MIRCSGAIVWVPFRFSLLKGTPAPKDYASFGDIYVPSEMLTLNGDDKAAAIRALENDDQFDHVQILANEAARIYKSTWVWGEKVAGGTLEIRMNAERSKMILLGEGYKARNLGGTEGWTTVDRGIPRDTEYYHTANEFTVRQLPSFNPFLQPFRAPSCVVISLPCATPHPAPCGMLYFRTHTVFNAGWCYQSVVCPI